MNAAYYGGRYERLNAAEEERAGFVEHYSQFYRENKYRRDGYRLEAYRYQNEYRGGGKNVGENEVVVRDIYKIFCENALAGDKCRGRVFAYGFFKCIYLCVEFVRGGRILRVYHHELIAGVCAYLSHFVRENFLRDAAADNGVERYNGVYAVYILNVLCHGVDRFGGHILIEYDEMRGRHVEFFFELCKRLDRAHVLRQRLRHIIVYRHFPLADNCRNE